MASYIALITSLMVVHHVMLTVPENFVYMAGAEEH